MDGMENLLMLVVFIIRSVGVSKVSPTGVTALHDEVKHINLISTLSKRN